jgi:hypothetical protein
MEADCHVDLQTGSPTATPAPREFGESLIRKKRCAGRIHGERGAFFRERIRCGVALTGRSVALARTTDSLSLTGHSIQKIHSLHGTFQCNS